MVTEGSIKKVRQASRFVQILQRAGDAGNS
jgi:hypothetical protein